KIVKALLGDHHRELCVGSLVELTLRDDGAQDRHGQEREQQAADDERAQAIGLGLIARAYRHKERTRRRPDSNWGIGLLQSPALPLGYVAGTMERVAGIEPARRPWEGHRLPLHHTRRREASGFGEPKPPSWSACFA